jgi:sulfonate transport system substrate-binding protein
LLSNLYVEGLRQQKAFLLREGFVQADFAYDEWILRKPLELARKLAEEIEFSRAA